MMRLRSESGFTLVELSVALFIFGLISAAGVALMRFSVDSQIASREALGEMAAIRRMSASLSSDLGQAAPRATRDEAGAPQNAFFGGSGADGDMLLGFVRRGWSNYDGAPRSSLQKVEYRLVGDRLERRAYPYVDGAAPFEPAVLISGVEAVRLRYRFGAEWRDRWDPTRADSIPAAVELVLDIEGLGPVRQLYLAGYGL